MRAYLSVTEGLEDGWLTERPLARTWLFTAGCWIACRVLTRNWDRGRWGFGDDSLFSWQLEKAGFRLGRAPEAVVEHHCDESRLLRRHYLDSARKNGRLQAYLLHHWKHETIALPRMRHAYALLKLLRRRIISHSDTSRAEGCAEWEISLNAELEKYCAFLNERRRPRNYEKFGLVKLRPQ